MNAVATKVRLVAGIGALALVLGACGSSKDKAAAGSGKVTTTTAKAADDMEDMDHGHAAGSHDAGSDNSGHGTVLAGTATGDSPCETALAKPSSPGQANESGAEGTDAEGGHGTRGMIKQLPLSNAERELLAKQMIQARTVIDKYPTVKVAEAAGYEKSTVFLPCIGAHYTNLKYLAFDPANPSELLFDGTNPDSKIIGLSYLVFNAKGAPEGFAGPNDHFHQHNANGGLCLKDGVGVIGGEDQSVEDCEKAGGKKGGKIMENIWMAHAWVAPGWECSWGVFAGECPELGGRVGGTAQDDPKK
jgi:hypothetical protein